VQQHEREQAERLGILEQCDQQLREPNGLSAKIISHQRRTGAGGIACVEMR
jgi:hypothetical protein